MASRQQSWVLGSLLLHGLERSVHAAVSGDFVKRLPGFPEVSFGVYSGYLTVPGPFTLTPDVDELRIHYQLHMSQRDPASDPLVTWHQGGPGGSSIAVGLYTEMGYFQVDNAGTHVNPYAWNRLANMLYLESPAGSGGKSGFSTCHKGGDIVDCSWDDRTQAEAYAHTLLAFLRAYPELATNELYLTGESYFGQYGPNIAHYILNNDPFAKKLNLKGIALGNACWGGNDTVVQCNGPHETRNDIELFFGKALISPELRSKALAVCSEPEVPDGEGAGIVPTDCAKVMKEVHRATGPFNIYNLYDNCADSSERLQHEGEDGYSSMQNLRRLHFSGKGGGGGYDWSCGGMDATERYLARTDVLHALHLGTPGQSTFSYTLSGPASITLYPELVKKIRVFIYNGDADGCVPYIGNQEWISGLTDAGVLKERSPWAPWFTDDEPHVPAGYETEYEVSGSDKQFSFYTVRLAGHMVPTFQPRVALDLFKRFLESSLDGVKQHELLV